MIYKTTFNSPVGLLTLASDGENLVGLWIAGQKYDEASIKGAESEICDTLPVFAAAKDWLSRYFAGERPAISELPLAPAGSDFRQTVWKILCEIPYGQDTTYGAISRAVAASCGKEKMSAQAVGGAVGHNPISIIIPCHRVVGSDGSLTGYAGGVEVKSMLLQHEGVCVSDTFYIERSPDK